MSMIHLVQTVKEDFTTLNPQAQNKELWLVLETMAAKIDVLEQKLKVESERANRNWEIVRVAFGGK